MTSILWTDFMTNILVTDLTDIMTDILGTNYYKHTGDRLYENIFLLDMMTDILGTTCVKHTGTRSYYTNTGDIPDDRHIHDPF